MCYARHSAKMISNWKMPAHTHTRTNGDSVRGHRISIVIRSPFSQCFDHSLPTLASRSAIGSFSCGRDVPSVDPWPEFFSCLELFPLSYIHTFTYVDTRTGKHLCKGRISLIIYSKILFLINAHRCYSIPRRAGRMGKIGLALAPLTRVNGDDQLLRTDPNSAP